MEMEEGGTDRLVEPAEGEKMEARFSQIGRSYPVPLKAEAARMGKVVACLPFRLG